MIIEFRVRNFRSIRDDIRLSLAATTDKELAASNLVETGIKAVPRLTRSAVIYGPNASGKSNLVLALATLRELVVTSATAILPGQPFNHQPFRFDAATANQPTELEMTFVLNGIRHQYGCAFDAQRITEEWLLVYVTSRPQAWFHRKFDSVSGEDNYTYSTHLKGAKEVWQNATRPNALFLSTAAQLNSEQLFPIYRWFAEAVVVLPAGTAFLSDQTISSLQDTDRRALVMGLLAAADFGISNVDLVPRRGVHQKFEFKLDGSMDTSREEREMMMPQFTHQGETGAAVFELDQESQGTQRFFNLVGPIIDILQNGKLLIVDELDSSLHPLLVRRIVALFQTPELNTKGAQLVFTTHVTSLLDAPGVLRRDQVWLTEKHSDQATRLTPLTEFSPRKGEALERGYLSGRYGGVPMLSSFAQVLPATAEQH
jgi:AAA15 family ATPase/GTPase